MKLVLRECDESAKAFVADSFVRSYQGGSTPLAHVDPAERSRALRKWLNERWTDVRIMTGEGEPDVFLGWVMASHDGCSAWYCYVKHDLRRHGLAREALAAMGLERVALTNREWQEEWRA